MSKRSYRRLAAVAGAALAVGSMAPAMAAKVGVQSNGAASASVEIPAIPDVVGGEEPSQIPSFLDGSISNIRDEIRTYRPILVQDVRNLVADADCAAGAGLDTALGASTGVAAGGNAVLNAGLSGAALNVRAIAAVLLVSQGPSAPLAEVSQCAEDLLGHGRDTVRHVREFGAALTPIATNMVMGEVNGSGFASGTVRTVVQAGLGVVDGISLSGNANLMAQVVGTL